MIKKILLLLLFTSSLAFAQKQDATRQIINLPQGYAQQSYAVDTGTAANAYAITLPNGTLVDGMAIGFRVAHANTGASTLSVNGGTALSIYKQGGTIALAPGDLQVGQQVIVSYSASQSAFQMQTGSGSPNLVAQTVVVGTTVSASGTALGYQSPLQRFLASPLNAKTIIKSGDSTVSGTTTTFDSMCWRTGPGQEFAGMACYPATTYSIDSSHNVTVTTLMNHNYQVGQYVTMTGSGAGWANIVGSSTPAWPITAVTANTFTFYNATSTISTSGSVPGNTTVQFLNSGSNGQTQAGFNTASGVGSLAFTLAQCPDLNIHRGMGINDVRLGGVNQAILTGYIKTYLDAVRAGCPNTDILLLTENSLEASDPGSNGWVTSPSTTSSTAVAGAGSVTITLATMLNSIYGLVTPDLTLAQEVANGSASLVIDDGTHGTQETVPITAINGSTVTAIFANAHTAGFTVVPNLATMAQSYSNIIHDAVMSFVGYAPNVVVGDTQTHIFGRLVQATTPFMLNQLHPNGVGQDEESVFVAGIVDKARNIGSSKGSEQLATIPTTRYASKTAYSPMLAMSAMLSSYAACWSYYPQCVENPDYYTLVGEGTLNAYSSGSYIFVSAEVDSLATNGKFGVIPGQGYDLVEFVGFGTVQVGYNATFTNTAGYTLVGASVPAIPWTMPTQQAGTFSGTPVRVYRAKYVDPAAEVYAKSPNTYRTIRYAQLGNSGATVFYFNGGLAADPNQLPAANENSFSPTTDKIVCQGIGDLSTIIGSYSSMSCSLSVGVWWCSGGTSVPTLSNAYCQIFYTDPAEQVARNLIAKKNVFAPAFVSSGTAATLSGCSYSAAVGGASAGKFLSGTTGTCTVAITLPSAPNGWFCRANDITTPADTLAQTGVSATSATVSGTTVTSDVINWACSAY